jgi:hypothetical protein
MKNASNPRRGRGRNNGKRNQNPRGRNIDGGGNDPKIRGSAQQVLDKYLTLARDAFSAGDRIAAEGFFQHAEHYHRVLNPEGGQPSIVQDRNHNNTGSRRVEPQPQPDDALSKQSEADLPLAEQVEDTFKEPFAEAVVKEAGVVEKNPRRTARPRKDKSADTADENKKDSETAA